MSLEEDNKPILLEDLGTHYPSETSKDRKRYGLYKCGYCGKEFKARTAHILRGATKSCGCVHSPHGLARHPLYSTWKNMRSRCLDKSNSKYENYGGRGISICKEWLDVKNFIEWAESTYVEGMSLDRIDNDGNYEPSNCRWADITTQSINKGVRKDNTSGFVGVHLDIKTQMWITQISYHNKIHKLGKFVSIEEAVQTRDNYIIENNLPHKLSKDYKRNDNEK